MREELKEPKHVPLWKQYVSKQDAQVSPFYHQMMGEMQGGKVQQFISSIGSFWAAAISALLGIAIEVILTNNGVPLRSVAVIAVAIFSGIATLGFGVLFVYLGVNAKKIPDLGEYTFNDIRNDKRFSADAIGDLDAFAKKFGLSPSDIKIVAQIENNPAIMANVMMLDGKKS